MVICDLHSRAAWCYTIFMTVMDVGRVAVCILRKVSLDLFSFVYVQTCYQLFFYYFFKKKAFSLCVLSFCKSKSFEYMQVQNIINSRFTRLTRGHIWSCHKKSKTWNILYYFSPNLMTRNIFKNIFKNNILICNIYCNIVKIIS